MIMAVLEGIAMCSVLLIVCVVGMQYFHGSLWIPDDLERMDI